jgi:1,4-alpha-glucan branching enzyme
MYTMPLAGIQRSRYSAKNMAKPVSFRLAATEAETVFLAGDFNRWDHTSHPLERQADGWWTLSVPLTHGHHQYYFVVDGWPTLDPQAMGKVTNELGQPASLLAVS